MEHNLVQFVIRTNTRLNSAAAGEPNYRGQRLIGDVIMASWTSFAWGFFAGLLVGEVTLVFFLALVRQNAADGAAKYSPPLTPEHETFGPATSSGNVPA